MTSKYRSLDDIRREIKVGLWLAWVFFVGILLLGLFGCTP